MLAAFDWHVLWQRLFHPDHAFWLALWRTVLMAVLAQVIGVILGLVAALMRMSRVFALRALSNVYTLVFRGTPVIVQIFFVYFGVVWRRALKGDSAKRHTAAVWPWLAAGGCAAAWLVIGWQTAMLVGAFPGETPVWLPIDTIGRFIILIALMIGFGFFIYLGAQSQTGRGDGS